MAASPSRLTLSRLTLARVNDLVYAVKDGEGDHVGNLKRIAAPAGPVWKFKAVGYDMDGSVIPGGGPLTQRHNTAFATLDEAALDAELLGPSPPIPHSP